MCNLLRTVEATWKQLHVHGWDISLQCSCISLRLLHIMQYSSRVHAHTMTGTGFIAIHSSCSCVRPLVCQAAQSPICPHARSPVRSSKRTTMRLAVCPPFVLLHTRPSCPLVHLRAWSSVRPRMSPAAAPFDRSSAHFWAYSFLHAHLSARTSVRLSVRSVVWAYARSSVRALLLPTARASHYSSLINGA